ncbi:MAG: stage II sporulation protein P, partial [Faecalibacterium sp.]|nr:stage II sporulation protein P [Faecalibacterium sp.]
LVCALALAAPGRLAVLSCFVASPGTALRAAVLTTEAQTKPQQPGGGESPTLPLPTATPLPLAGAEDLPYMELWGSDRHPDNAGTVIEKTYGHGSGDNYISLAAGSIKNNTKTSAETVAAAAAAGLPFAVERNSDQPQVLIMHTHATETYRLSAGLWHLPDDSFRSTDRAVDMCAVGAVMADTLNAAGICTLHDVTLNDYPSYNGSYDNSRAVVQQYLAQYPSIKVVLDVHRDAIETNGCPVAPVVEIGGRKAAQVMIISGCDNGTTVKLPNWKKNLGFAAAWESRMESMYPGLTRPVLFSHRFYNQDLTTGSLLIEIGGHGNNLNEALYAGYLVANALADLFGATE